ncbi:MAG: LamG domain-containing protein [Candidatus Woesearchaeota archaeon]
MINKKAAIYTMDSMMAIFMTIIIIMTAVGYFNRAAYNEILLAQPNQIASDVLTIMHKSNVLQQYYLENQNFFNRGIKDKAGTRHCQMEGNPILKTEIEDYYNFLLILDGNNSYINCGNDFNMTEQNFSISFWFKTNNSIEDNKKQWIISKINESGEGYGIFIQNSTIRIYYKINSTSNELPLNININNNEWHHFTAVFDRENNNLTGYINTSYNRSINISNIEGKNLSNDANFVIGYIYHNETNDVYFNGTLDDIRIFGKALTESEIQSIYENISIATTQLISRYDFNVDAINIKDRINNYLPNQYQMMIRLYDSNGNIIASEPLRYTSGLINLITTGERIITINKTNNIEDVVKVRYYAWTQ